MPRLIAFGDSMTWGSDLQDCREIPPTPSNNTWPALLAQSLGLDYVCLAFPGIGNDSITRYFSNYIGQINSDDIVIVNWTWIDRWEYYNENVPLFNTCLHSLDQFQWTQVLPNDRGEHRDYWRNYHSELGDKLRSLKNIMMVMQQLDTVGCRHFHTCIDNLIRDNTCHCPVYVENLQSIVKPRLQWFEDQGFLDWARRGEFTISETWHPLEAAHQAACVLMRN
jgi:hypothetical protein